MDYYLLYLKYILEKVWLTGNWNIFILTQRLGMQVKNAHFTFYTLFCGWPVSYGIKWKRLGVYVMKAQRKPHNIFYLHTILLQIII